MFVILLCVEVVVALCARVCVRYQGSWKTDDGQESKSIDTSKPAKSQTKRNRIRGVVGAPCLAYNSNRTKTQALNKSFVRASALAGWLAHRIHRTHQTRDGQTGTGIFSVYFFFF